MNTNRIAAIAVILTASTLSLAGCGDSTAYSFHKPVPMLHDVAASPLQVAPKALAPDFGVTLIGADTGGGTDPLTGPDAARATRFYGEFARNGVGALDWCAARPAQYAQMCGFDLPAGDEDYFHGRVDGLKVRAYGSGYPTPPRAASDFTTSPASATWAR